MIDPDPAAEPAELRPAPARGEVDSDASRPGAGAAPPCHEDEPAAAPVIDVDAELVARSLGLEVSDFRTLMRAGKIRTLSERGVGQDEGRFRLSFYYRERRLRLVTDAAGEVIALDG